MRTRLRPLQVPLIALATGLGAILPAMGPAKAERFSKDDRPRAPNVVLILADDLGYGDLAGYGAPDMRTPHLDALVDAGMRFDNFYANCPVCSPTRAALLTGRYPDTVGVPGVIRTHPEDNWGFLDPSVTLLPQRLKAAGYQTALVGKWHLGLESPNTPNERGFDEFHGFLGDMMDDYDDHRRHGENYMRHNAEEIDPEGHATDLFTRWAIEYLDSRKSDDPPFFLYLAYNAPHTPIQPPEDWLAKVKQREGDAITDPRARLVALIEHMDDGIGRMIEALHRNGQARETLVLFTSDNGGQLSVGARGGEHRGGKGDLYEGGLRVPFCAVWPGRIEAGSRSEQVALTMDLFPTICDAAGVEAGSPIDGRSILPTLLGQEPTVEERDLFWMRREGGSRYLGQDYHAVRRGHWKLVQNTPFEPFQLYHLGEDPLERVDRSAMERAVVDRLSRSLRKHVQAAGEVPWQRSSR